MNVALLRAFLYLRQLVEDEHGQDLVEYALVVALIAFSAVTGMRYLATGINQAFSVIAVKLVADI